MKSVRLQVAIPKRGFRWLSRDSKGNWILADPPLDWSEQDHLAAESDERVPWDEARNYYLAAASNECTGGTVALLDQPNIHLFFAVERPTPSTILKYANLFGLLGAWESNQQSIGARQARGIIREFDWGALEDSRFLPLQLEPASCWLLAFAQTAALVREWTALAEKGEVRRVVRRHRKGEPSAVVDLLEKTYPHGGEGNLMFSLGFEFDGTIRTQLRASSLRDLIRVQFGLALAAGASHRRCQECGVWFVVRPGIGRPDKKFCSTACRVRALRKRKRAVK